MGRQRELLRLSIILCMGLLFVMAGILLIVGKLAGKRPSSIAGGVLMIAWGLLCGIPELRSWMLARATDLEHTLEAMWAGLDGDGRMMTSIDGLFAILEDRGLMPAVALFSLSAVLALGRSRASLPELREPQKAPNPTSDRTWMPGIPCAVAWPVFRCQSCGFVEKGHSREGK